MEISAGKQIVFFRGGEHHRRRLDAILVGEVSGNWNNTGSRPAIGGGSEKSTVIDAPLLVSPTGDEIVIPIGVKGIANKGIISYEFDLRYDPLVIQPQKNPVDLAGTVSRGLSVVLNAEKPGLLRVAVYGPMPITGNGVLMNLRFTSIGSSGSVSPLTWERIMLNEGSPQIVTTDGQVELSSSAQNQGEISGRLLNSMGQGIPNAHVTLTDTSGQPRSILSNGFGFYRIAGLQMGQTYTVSVKSRGWTFTPLMVSVTQQMTSVDMIAGQ